jgi:hypothetical protein
MEEEKTQSQKGNKSNIVKTPKPWQTASIILFLKPFSPLPRWERLGEGEEKRKFFKSQKCLTFWKRKRERDSPFQGVNQSGTRKTCTPV